MSPYKTIPTNIKAILWVILANLCFTGTAILSKWISPDLSNFVVVSVRGIFRLFINILSNYSSISTTRYSVEKNSFFKEHPFMEYHPWYFCIWQYILCLLCIPSPTSFCCYFYRFCLPSFYCGPIDTIFKRGPHKNTADYINFRIHRNFNRS